MKRISAVKSILALGTLALFLSFPFSAKALLGGEKCNQDSDCDGAYVCYCSGTGCTKTCSFSQTKFDQLKAKNPSLSAVASTNKTASASKALTFTPQVGIPNTSFSGGTVTVSNSTLANYTGALYTYTLSIVGILAVIMIMVAGLLWLTSRGDSGQIGKAKKMMGGALIGLGLVVGTSLLLRTINPNLIELNPIQGITNLNNITVTPGCCQYKNSAEMTNQDSCKENGGTFTDSGITENNKCTTAGCAVLMSRNSTDDPFKVLQCQDGTQTYANSYAKGYSSDKLKVYFESKPCNQVSECFASDGTARNVCNNAGEGERIYQQNFASGVTGSALSKTLGWCYGNKLYSGEGSKGEPCGDNAGSTCHAACSNTDENDITNINLTTENNYRSCISGLSCCKKNGIATN